MLHYRAQTFTKIALAIYNGASLWNSLPFDAREAESLRQRCIRHSIRGKQLFKFNYFLLLVSSFSWRILDRV